MSGVETLVYRLWYGPLRRLFRASVTRIVPERHRVLLGPLRGCQLTVRSWAYTLGIFELHVQRAILGALKSGDVFYDIGANNGYVTLLAARAVGPQGHVYAFEPLPENVRDLDDLLSANGIRNCTVVTSAVSHESGEVRLFVSTSDKTPSLLTRATAQDSLVVRSVTLDEFVRDHRPPSLIKVDVEGAESLVLRGAPAVLADASSPAWIIEVHDEGNERHVLASMNSHGYQLRAVNPIVHGKAYPRHVFASKAPAAAAH